MDTDTSNIGLNKQFAGRTISDLYKYQKMVWVLDQSCL